MNRMIPYFLIASAGLALCGWLVLRHAIRTSGEEPAAGRRAAPTSRRQPADRWQEGIRVDTGADYAPGPKAKAPVDGKLRREELRQKPWERRN